MKDDCRSESAARRILVRPLGRLAVLAVLIAALTGCSSGGDGIFVPFDELLIVSDGITVTSYSVSGGMPTQRDSAMIMGIPGTYSRTGTLVTITMEKHNVPDSHKILLDFAPGTGGTATDGTYVATFVDQDTFEITDTVAGSITDGTVLRSPTIQFGATYSQAGTVVTITLTGHGLDGGDMVILDYTSGAAVDDDTFVDTVVDADTFEVVADAAANTSGDVDVVAGGNYTIFGIAMHPSGDWLYVTSTYDCFQGSPYCWGGDLISRFAIDWSSGGLTFEESYRTSDEPSPNISTPSPVTLVFSADGMQLFHQDDDLDGLRMWDVDPLSGDLMLIAATAEGTTGQHGIAVSDDGTRVYHGDRVFSVGPASITKIPGGQSGEANQIVGGTMFALLGGGQGAQIRAFSLADPDLPLELAASADTPNHARGLAMVNGGALIVASGWGGLKSYDYDGAAITPSVGTGDTEFRDGGMPFPLNPGDEVSRVYRTISLNAAEDLVAAAYFTHDPDAGTGGIPPSGFILVDVAADGSLSLAGDYPGANYARVARFFSRP